MPMDKYLEKARDLLNSPIGGDIERALFLKMAILSGIIGLQMNLQQQSLMALLKHYIALKEVWPIGRNKLQNIVNKGLIWKLRKNINVLVVAIIHWKMNQGILIFVQYVFGRMIISSLLILIITAAQIL